MAYLVVLVIDNLDHCHPVLDAWEEVGVTGVTILESSGIGRARRAGLRRDDYPLMLSLTDILQSKERHHRTVFSVVDTEISSPHYRNDLKAELADRLLE